MRRVASVERLSTTMISSAGSVCSIAATTQARIVVASLYAGMTMETVGESGDAMAPTLSA